MRHRSVILAALAVLIVTAAVAVTVVIRAGESGASGATQTGPPVTPVGATETAASPGAGSGSATVTVSALQLSGSDGATVGSGGPDSPASSSTPATSSATSTTTTPTPAKKTRSTSTTPTTTPPAAVTTSSTHTSSTTTRTSTTYPSYHDTITPQAEPAPAAVQKLVVAAVQRAARSGITQSVVVLNRRTGKTEVSIDADRPVPAVSIAKLLFAADELHQAGGGSHLDAEAAANLFDMLRRSNDDLASDYYGYNGESAIVQRVAEEYHLTGTSPAPNPRYWGGITVTAADIASLLQQMLDDPSTGPYLAAPMRASSEIAADGYDQEFGMNAVSGAGSKQGWGCCLGGVVAIHSAGFTADEIVVVLSTAYPDASGINVPEVSAFENDPGFKASVASVTATAKAAVDPGG